MTNRHELELAKRVLWVRHAQLAINERLSAGQFRVPVHLALGHEAVAVAVTSNLGNDDRLLLSHRNLHYNLSRLGVLKPIVDEFLGRESGLAGGRLGSMNLSNPEAGLSYTSSILGNNLAVAAGAATALKQQGRAGVAFVVTGDGAMEEGVFYESLLLAGSAGAPMVVIVENNDWSMYTRISERRRTIDLESYARSVDAGYSKASGSDVIELEEVIGKARDNALSRGAPGIVEVSVSTLGDFMANDRLINYHHGPAPKIEWEMVPILDSPAKDPVAYLFEKLDAAEFRELAVSAFEELRGEDD